MQMAIMTYDTALYLPWLYGNLTAWTASWCARQGLKDVPIGVPTYDEVTAGHWPSVESIGNALRGLKQGEAATPPALRSRIGAAVYAEWTTSPAEREIYLREWIGVSSRGKNGPASL